ncbi:MAG TPA: tripartite tricarboxylate transporter substrate binding protein [Reyranellaceae bacterium]|nr:tripartite tricarboxylate transporter substrate binding protein [Reyranellaceae bacterium]
MIRRSLFGAFAALLLAGPALAQPFPNKPIRMVVGYSAGGGNDLIARIVSAKLQEKLGQPVVVDNKPGAASIIAAELVAKAAPDGYTLLMAPSGPMTINPAVYTKLPYDPAKDFAPISLLAEFPLMLVVGADQPIKSVKELIEFARANPAKANCASSATPFQLASELFNQRTQSKFQHIPYRGSGDMAQAVVSGQVLMAIADTAPISGLLNGGKLRALAITSAKRNPAFPDVPTMGEAGLSGLEIALWTGLVAPAGTPADVIAKLNAAVRDVLAMEDVKTALGKLAVEPVATSPEEYRGLIARDAARWKDVASTANIKVE